MKTCNGKTNSGKRCSRKVKKDGLCWQHLKKRRERVKKLTDYPPGLLDQVPDPPTDLGKRAAAQWGQYCQYLIDGNCLRGIYLPGIHQLCRLEQDMEEIRSDIEEKGRYNEYVTQAGTPGTQVNGVVSAMNTTQKQIDKLREVYQLVPAKPKKDSQEVSKPKKQDPKLRSVKNF